MGAWLLFLIVLATFKPIVQVASTDETSPSSVSKSKLLSYTSSSSSTATATATAGTSLVLPSPSPSSSPSSSSSSSIPFPVIDNFNSNNILSDSDSSDLSSENKLVQEKTIVQMESKIKSSGDELSTASSSTSISSSSTTTTTSTSSTTTSSATFGDGDDRSSVQNDQSTDHDEINDDIDDNQVDSETTINSSSNDINYSYSDSSILTAKKPDPDTLVEIENSLLSLFNMKRRPKIDRSKVVVPEAMKKLYAQIMGEELDSVNIPKPGLLTKSANTVRSFTHKDSKIDDRFPHHHRFRLHFEVNTIPAEEKLKAAELSLSRDLIRGLGSAAANRSSYQVLVYDILRVGIKGKREPTYLLLDSKQVRLNSTEVVSFDVQPAVDRWLATPKNNYGLLVEVRTTKTLKPAPHHHIRLRRSANESPDEWAHKQPLLFTYTDDGRHKSRSIRDMSRPKRAHHSRKSNRRKNNDEICRRHSLYVDFSDVGWADWILAPPGYDAYYCHGKCPFPLADHLNTTNHAVIQTLVNNIHPGKVPKPCCVPTQLTGISMLYLNEQNVVLKSYQDMTVVGCGCR